MEKRLTEKDYQKLLLNRFDDPEIKFVNADIKSLSENAEGFMGEHFKLKLTYSKDGIENSDNLFIKTKPFNMTDDHPVNADNIYDKEIFIYDFLFKEFEKQGYETNFSPKCYQCVNGETLIMEDMADKEFHLPGRQLYYDVSQVRTLLKSLALLHAASFAYEQTKSVSIATKYPLAMKEILFTQYTTGAGFGSYWFKTSILNFKTVIDLLPNDETFKDKFKNLLDKAEFGKIFIEDHGLKKTCTHGDLWSNNMMFKSSNGAAEACCLVDYQATRWFYPGFDVLLATHFNTDEEFCNNHLKEMYQYYYDTLSDAVKKYGYSIEEFLTLEEYKKSLDICSMGAMLQIASVNSMVFVPADFLTKVVKKHELATKEGEYNNFKEQMKEMKKQFCPLAFKNDEIYRKAMTKHLYDLYDALENKYCEE